MKECADWGCKMSNNLLKMNKAVRSFVLLLLLCCISVHAETAIDRLLVNYNRIESLSCKIRRVSEVGDQKVRRLSRIYWKRGDFIHVDNIAPLKRRIIADGKHFYYYITGEPKGFSRPIEQLSGEQIAELRRVPGTPMDHLLKLKGLEEELLKPKDAGGLSFGYKGDGFFAEVNTDERNRLSSILYYEGDAQGRMQARYDYSEYKEIMSGLWMPLKHDAQILIGKEDGSETLRVSDLTVNEPIAEGLFIADHFLKGVDYVKTFKEIYE